MTLQMVGVLRTAYTLFHGTLLSAEGRVHNLMDK